MFDTIRGMLVLPQRPQPDDVVRQIAKRSVMEVLRRLSAKVSQMGEAELRGYVRARALRPVRNEAERIAVENGWSTAATDAVIDAAVERAVHLIIHSMKAQPVSTSAMHATLRAAS